MQYSSCLACAARGWVILPAVLDGDLPRVDMHFVLGVWILVRGLNSGVLLEEEARRKDGCDEQITVGLAGRLGRRFTGPGHGGHDLGIDTEGTAARCLPEP